jgi:branched-chain amino acid transport system ATP-binding protein
MTTTPLVPQPGGSTPAGEVEVLALELRQVTGGYGRTTVLHEVSLAVPTGSVVALLGPNGAGKSTLLRTASGLLKPSSGEVLLGGDDVTRLEPFRRAERGLCHIPEGRGIFRSLTVHDNLRLSLPPWAKDASPMAQALEAFPILKSRSSQLAGSLSGGEQQMLAVARAYLSSPRVVLVDEVSIGLAPLLVNQIYDSLRSLAAMGVALLLVEQYVHKVLSLCDQVYVINHGLIRYHGSPDELDTDMLAEEYIGADRDGGGEG